MKYELRLDDDMLSVIGKIDACLADLALYQTPGAQSMQELRWASLAYHDAESCKAAMYRIEAIRHFVDDAVVSISEDYGAEGVRLLLDIAGRQLARCYDALECYMYGDNFMWVAM